MIDPRFYQRRAPLTLMQIVDLTRSELSEKTNVDKLIHDVATLEEGQQTDVACLHNAKYIKHLSTSAVGACFLTVDHAEKIPTTMVGLITPSPYRAFGLVIQTLYPQVDRVFSASSQPIHDTAQVAEGSIIEYGVVIHQHAQVGRNVRIGANSVIGPGVVIGHDCVIEPGVCISHSIVGNDVIIYSGARIGQAGFGFAMDNRGHIKVPQLGRVIIGNDVEIGANTTIDRGSLQDTVIGDGCRLDNLVQIGHNVQLGKGCVIVAQVGIAGSTHVGNYVAMGGQVGIAGHLKIGNHVKIAAQSGVMRDIDDHETVSGSPSMPIKQWHRLTVVQQQLIQRKGTRV